MANHTSYPKYQVNPEAELQGAALLTLTASQNLYNFEDLVKKYEYDKVNADDWYQLDSALQFMFELTERQNTTENMVSIGMKLFDVMPFPEGVETILDGLHLFNVMNTIVQRNVQPNRDWYGVKSIEDNYIQFTDTGPYPHDLVYGEVYSVVQRLRPSGFTFTVTRDYLNVGNPDADGAVYHIKLKK